MRYILDTNVLLRLVLVDEPDHPVVLNAVTKLESEGHELCCTTQSLREFWHVGTRSSEANGLGRSPEDILALISEICGRCRVLSEDAATFDEWLTLVSSASVRGAACHDANHIAIAKAHRVDRVMTFDLGHFNRFTASGIVAVSPRDI
ncbi:MAG: type II toxin-antitoxin system VapC family toxin [Fimbriimonadales bacterium]